MTLSLEEYDRLCLVESKKHIKEEDFIIFDVGANIGKFALLAKNELSEKKIFFHLFEPNKKAFFELNKNVEQAKFNNFALYKENNKYLLFFPEKFTSLGSFIKRQEIQLDENKFGKINIQEVNSATLDQYVEENNIHRIDYLKIDTEGTELDVLLGSKNSLKNKLIKCGQFEYGTTFEDANIKLKDVIKYLNDHGYLVYDVETKKYVNQDFKDDYRSINYFFHLEE